MDRPTAPAAILVEAGVDPDDLIARAQVEADRHRPEPGGCTCGFCAWSVEHVLIMSMREVLGW